MAPAPPPPPSVEETFRIERVTATSPSRVFAIARGRLFRTLDGRWSELSIGGVSVRDVTAAQGAVWVLTRGSGANSGRVAVLRIAGTDDVTVATTFVTPGEHDPRALAVVSDHEFFVGGANPSLLRLRIWGALQSQAQAVASPVDGLLYMPDSMMLLRYEGGGAAMYRWGEVNAIEREGYLFSFTGARESLMILRNGAVWRGRVWEAALPGDQMSGSSGIMPVTAATLRDERVVVIDAAGRTRLLNNGHWVDVRGTQVPGGDVMLVGARALTEGLCLRVDRSGNVDELVGFAWTRKITATNTAPL
jgi:hypothetical protein